MCALNYRFKLWVVNDKNQAVFGDGLARLLEEIAKHHSVLEASKQIGMSYRYALHRITLAEERLGETLVIRIRGGAKGGGFSEVTTFGKTLVTQFRQTQNTLETTLKKPA